MLFVRTENGLVQYELFEIKMKLRINIVKFLHLFFLFFSDNVMQMFI